MSTVIAVEGAWTLERFGKDTPILRHDCIQKLRWLGWGIDDEMVVNVEPPKCHFCHKQAPSNIEAMYRVAKMCVAEAPWSPIHYSTVTFPSWDARFRGWG